MKLVLEVRVEDMPSAVLENLPGLLSRAAARLLDEARLAPASLEALVTARRIALVADGLPEKQPEREIEVSGPPRRVAFNPDGSLAPAGQGYCRAQGIEPGELLFRVEGKRESVYFLRKEPGRPAAELLPGLLGSLLADLPWPLPMRWGREKTPFIRPVTGILCLLDDRLLPVSFAGRRARAVSRGHPTLSPASFPVGSAADWRPELEARSVILDPAARCAALETAVQALAGEAVFDRQALAGLSRSLEYPACAACALDLSGVEYPPEIVASVISNLRCLPLYRPDGTLEPRFVIVAEGQVTPEIERGFLWVLENRMADARFFWAEDRHLSLEDLGGRLGQVVFQAGVGTMADYQEALGRLVVELGRSAGLPPGELGLLPAAAGFAKVDLTTSMVREFPEIAGVYAARLAGLAGVPGPVCRLVREHHLPRFPGDRVPGDRLACVLALADKSLALAGLFLSGAEVTGTSDPYGLRRLAQGVADLAWAGRLRLSLAGVASSALAAWGCADRDRAARLAAFLRQRLENTLVGRGVRADIAAAALGAGDDTLGFLIARARAIEGFLARPGGPEALTAFSRVTNIVAQAGEKGVSFGPFRAGLCRPGAEKDFYDAWCLEKPAVVEALEGGNFELALEILARLRGPVDRFFDEVLVMDPDAEVRANRLGLLADIAGRLLGVGDLRKVREPVAPAS